MKHQKVLFWRTPSGWAAIGLIAAASYFLLVEHGEHVFPFLPYLILLLCPFMHFFMHGNHGEGHETNGEEDETNSLDENDKYRQGFIEGLEHGRKENDDKETDDAR